MAEAALAAAPAARASWAGGRALPVLLLGLLALRLAVMLASGAGLHVDEAQYWDWSRALHWGYYSKPPLIAALIAASTALFGDGLAGVRLGAMACWLGASAVLWRLGAAMGSPRAGVRAAWLLAATPASGLLGLVATTDAPLLLCWTLAMAATWAALRAPAPGRAWALAGLAFGVGLLAKYTMAALALSWLWLAWRSPAGTRWRWRGPLLALVLGGLLLAPNLAWNAAQGWPTLRHTAEITAAADRGRGGLGALAVFVAGQALLLGPVLWPLVRAGRRRAPIAKDERHIAPTSFALAFALPLLALGAAQALHAGAQINWTAPALAGLCLWTALRWDGGTADHGRGLAAPVAAGVLLSAALALAGQAVAQGGPHAPPTWDLWARMRGWQPALDALRPALAAQPGLPVAAQPRELLAQAAYAWRDTGRAPQAWPVDGPPHHHYEQVTRLSLQALPPSLLWLGEAPPPASMAARYARLTPLAQARDGRVALQLWRADGLRPPAP